MKKKKNLQLKNNDLPDFFFPKQTIHKESSPGIKGLLNIGSIYFINPILQCLSNINRLRAALLNKDIYYILEINQKTTKELSYALADILKNLWQNLKHPYYSPKNFTEVIYKLYPFKKEMQNDDIIELLIFILKRLHKELNNSKNNNLIDGNNIQSTTNFNEFYNNFKNNNESIISDEFYGFYDTIIFCGNCKYQNHKFMDNIYITFPLEEVKNFIGMNLNLVRINNCFEYIERYENSNSFQCSYCGSTISLVQNKILYGPKTLIIKLEHGNKQGESNNNNITLVFEEYLNLRKYIFFKESPFCYELVGVISLITNNSGKNFIAYCKNSINCQWYLYDDQNVYKSCFNEVRENGLPYILFYSYTEFC